MQDVLAKAPLGRKMAYVPEYSPGLLFPIARQTKRDEIHVPTPLPFVGCDVWNAYEVSWLNERGKPEVAVGEFIIPCQSPNVIEAKAFKFYLNSFNNTYVSSVEAVTDTLIQDLSDAAGAEVGVVLTPLAEVTPCITTVFHGTCLDQLDVACDNYVVHPNYLTTENEHVSEVLYSNLFKSNCLVTGQPDFASIQISYTGKKINHENLLKYLISFRNHNEFTEQCVERIFMHISKQCAPEKLTVHARFTRRGGMDINPFRSTHETSVPKNIRLCRQ